MTDATRVIDADRLSEAPLARNGPQESGVRSAFWQLLIFAAISGIALFARTALGPLQEAVRLSLALSDNQIAVVQGPALAIPMVVLGLPFGTLVDRVRRTRLLAVLLALTLLAGLATAQAANFASLVASRALVGFSSIAIFVVVSSLIADLFEPAARGRANMLVSIGQFAGISLAFAVGGQLLAHYGSAGLAWRYAAQSMCIPVAASFLLLLFAREPARGVARGSRVEGTHALRTLWRLRRRFGPILLGTVMIGVADGASMVWVEPLFLRDFGLSVSHAASIVAGVLLISGLGGPIVGGVLNDTALRLGGVKMGFWLLVILAAICVPAALFPLMPTIGLAIAPYAIFTLLGISISVVDVTLATIVLPVDVRGLGLGAMAALSLLFTFGISPLAVSTLAEVVGGPDSLALALTIVTATTCGLGTAAFYVAAILTSDADGA